MRNARFVLLAAALAAAIASPAAAWTERVDFRCEEHPSRNSPMAWRA